MSAPPLLAYPNLSFSFRDWTFKMEFLFALQTETTPINQTTKTLLTFQFNSTIFYLLALFLFLVFYDLRIVLFFCFSLPGVSNPILAKNTPSLLY